MEEVEESPPSIPSLVDTSEFTDDQKKALTSLVFGTDRMFRENIKSNKELSEVMPSPKTQVLSESPELAQDSFRFVVVVKGTKDMVGPMKEYYEELLASMFGNAIHAIRLNTDHNKTFASLKVPFRLEIKYPKP